MNLSKCDQPQKLDVNNCLLSSCGRIAVRAIAAGGMGKVIAVFERSLYCRADSGLVFCLGMPSLGSGPLNVICDERASNANPLGAIRLRSTLTIHRRGIDFSNGQKFDSRLAEEWSPPRLICTPQAWQKRAGGLYRIRSLLRDRANPGGLAPFLLPMLGVDNSESERVLSNSITNQARPGIVALLKWLRTCKISPAMSPDVVSEIRNLVGLGPGLTPSGDDFLGGVLIALRQLGKLRSSVEPPTYSFAADAIWQAIEPHLPSHTNEISAAHLRAAASGMGHTYAHGALQSILEPDSRDRNVHIDRLTSLGHSSGWDTLLGLTCVVLSSFEMDQ